MALMDARLEAHVEHKLKARIYLHERIVEVLARKIPHRHPEMTKRLVRLPNTTYADLLGLPDGARSIAQGMAADHYYTF